MPLRQTYCNQLNDPLLASNSINTITGPNNLIRATGASPGGAYVAQPTIIPVNYLKPGTLIRTHAWGTYSSLTSATLVWGTYYGTTPLAVNVAVTAGTTPAAWPWEYWTTTIVRSAVVPSAVVTHTKGWLDFGTSLTALTRNPVPGVALTTVNVDNSVAAEWSVQLTYGASSASNIVVLHGLVIEETTQI